MNKHSIQIVAPVPNSTPCEKEVEKLTRAMSSWYVRKDGKYFDVSSPSDKFSRDDIQSVSVRRFTAEFPEVVLSTELLREVFKRAVVDISFVAGSGIQTWSGRQQCLAGNPMQLLERQGMVVINSWNQPDYRNVEDDGTEPGTVGDFFDAVFANSAEKGTFLDWLAWCLQNEDQKPSWGPLLYSKSKGTGKSTLCDIASRLFGEANSIRQNGVEKLTAKFNMPLLLSKLVISEELDIRPGSRAGNTLKTLMTETDAAGEVKGREVERVEQCFACMFTTNHLPLWIEEDDRRYWVVEIDHEGRSGGSKVSEFGELVGNVQTYLEYPAHVRRLYNWLMQRELPAGFSGKVFNSALCRTKVLDLVNANGGKATTEMARETLREHDIVAIAEADLVPLLSQKLNFSTEQIKHVMTELEWTRKKAKWGGVDYARMIWTAPNYTVVGGKLVTPDGERTEVQAIDEDPTDLFTLKKPTADTEAAMPGDLY